MALPAGAITAVATFSTYLIVLTTAAPTVEESRTAAVVTLFLAALWVLAIVCRPYTPWKVVMLVVVAGCMVYDLLDDWTRRFFALDPGNTEAMVIAVASGAVAALLLEAAAWVVRARGAAPRHG